MMGRESEVFWGVEIYTLCIFWGRDLSHIFLGLKKVCGHIWRAFTSLSEIFAAFSGSEDYSFELFFSNV